MLVERLIISPQEAALKSTNSYKCYFREMGGPAEHNHLESERSGFEQWDALKHPAYKGF